MAAVYSTPKTSSSDSKARAVQFPKEMKKEIIVRNKDNIFYCAWEKNKNKGIELMWESNEG